MRNLIFGICGLLLPALLINTAFAAPGDEIKAAHREAAQKYFDAYSNGVMLRGSIDQDGSKGDFIAYYMADEFYVRHSFGDLFWTSYSGPQGKWVSNNCSLPYQIEERDNPANTVLNLLSEGDYLDDQYFQYFNFVDEEAGGYNFRFAPPGLPEVGVVLYNDTEAANYLQIMQLEVPLSPLDPDAYTYRGIYYYKTDEAGRPVIEREVAKEFNHTGETATEKEFVVTAMEPITAAPADMQFSFERTPVGGEKVVLPEPLEIDVIAKDLRYMIPLTFDGSDKTFYFLFDTGASASLFSDEAAEAAGLKADLVIDGHGHGTVEEFEIGLVETASIGVAGSGKSAPLANLRCTRIPEGSTAINEMLKFYGAHGILGVAPLHQYIMSLDYDNSKLKLYSPGQFSETTDIEVPNVEVWIDVEDLIYFVAMIDGLKGEVILDTGLQLDLAVLRESMDMNGKQLKKVAERNSTVIGGVKQFDYVLVPSFNIGPLGWTDRQASVTDDAHGTLSARGVLGFVGVTMLIGNKVTIDAFSQRMYIVPSDMDQFKKQLEMLEPAPPEGAPVPPEVTQADSAGPTGAREG